MVQLSDHFAIDIIGLFWHLTQENEAIEQLSDTKEQRRRPKLEVRVAIGPTAGGNVVVARSRQDWLDVNT